MIPRTKFDPKVPTRSPVNVLQLADPSKSTDLIQNQPASFYIYTFSAFWIFGFGPNSREP